MNDEFSAQPAGEFEAEQMREHIARPPRGIASQIVDKAWSAQINDDGVAVPKDIQQVEQLAKIAIKGGFAPRGISLDQAKCSILMGLELGFTWLASLNYIKVVNGKPSLSGDGLLAKVLASGLMRSYEEYFIVDAEGLDEKQYDSFTEAAKAAGKERLDHVTAVGVYPRKGIETKKKFKFSVADARRANLWGKNVWATYPDRMLLYRARGFGLRDGYQDIIGGLITTEEAMDYPAPPSNGGGHRRDEFAA